MMNKNCTKCQKDCVGLACEDCGVRQGCAKLYSQDAAHPHPYDDEDGPDLFCPMCRPCLENHVYSCVRNAMEEGDDPYAESGDFMAKHELLDIEDE